MKSIRQLIAIAAVFGPAVARAEIYRWDNGQVIPGTEGILPGPRVDLAHFDLEFAWLSNRDLTGARFDSADLAFAQLHDSTLVDVVFNDADVSHATFNRTTSRGFTKEQLYSTASYKAKNLKGMGLTENDFRGWDFNGQDLTSAYLNFAVLSNANLSEALVAKAHFFDTTSRGFTKDQLYSTASYRARTLTGIDLMNNDLSGWDFSGQDLSNTRLYSSILSRAAFRGANLTGGILSFTMLDNADFRNSVVTGADFSGTTSSGFTKQQLYSTASYCMEDLSAISLGYNDLKGWNFSHQNLTNAKFLYATLVDADLRFADMRGAQFMDLAGAIQGNTILAGGEIAGLFIEDGDELVVRNYHGDPTRDPVPLAPIAIDVHVGMSVANTATIQLRLDADPWDSLISFAPGIPVQLNGTLELTFAPGVDILSQVGRTFQAFNWTGVSPTGTFTIASIYPWDVSELYTTGNVTLLLPGDTNGDHTVDLEDLNAVRNNFGGTGDGDTNHDGVVDLIDLNNVRNFFGASTPQAVPEPTSIALAASGVGLVLLARRQRRTRASLQCQEPIVDAPTGIH